MIKDALLKTLADSNCGAYAVSVDQTIVFWNEAAERMLGYAAQDVVGRRCYEVASGFQGTGLTSECLGGCPFVRYLRTGMIPAPIQLQMTCSSGERKWMTVTPMVAAGVLREGPLLIYFFEATGAEDGGPGDGGETGTSTSGGVGVETGLRGQDVASVLSRREVEVLRLVALGWDTPRIANELDISRHTVRNHIRNLRQRLSASTKLEAVLTAMRLGILDRK